MQAKGAATFVCNDGYRIAPFADLLYAADLSWWEYHIESGGLDGFKGHRLTCDFEASRRFGLDYVPLDRDIVWGGAGVIAGGLNSGFQLLNVADLHKPSRIILLGYDLQEKDGLAHWFGDHPSPLRRALPLDRFRKAFNRAAPRIKAPVVNCSRETALTCFLRASLKDALP